MALYNGYGNTVMLDGSPIPGSTMLPFWSAPDTYDGVSGDPVADDIISQMFDPLMEGNEGYFTKTNIGKDASDTYDMYEYVLTPDCYTQTIWIQSGVHSREKAAVFGLAHFLDELVNNWQSNVGLAYIRHNVRLVVIPIVNPWGLSQASPSNDSNSNGVNLNRDSVAETKQAETINVHSRFELYKDVLSFAIDFHTTVNSSYGDYGCLWTEAGADISKPSLEVLAYLSNKNIAVAPDLHYVGVYTSVRTFSYHFAQAGVESVILEHGDYRWGGNKYSDVSIQRSAELVTNSVIQYVGARFKTHAPVNRWYPEELTITNG